MKDENKEAKKFPCFLYISMITFISYIAEAIATSSKVIVLSKRPAIIKNIYDIKLDNPKNPILNRKDTKFNYYYDLIWKELEEYVTETNSLSKKN